ncbi:hypothetical protein [Gemmata obscuriglobus]|uniref:hypothetical protein n=1 Tax=Gemmata obscuriglobus TaxID=114 RepID=UPI0013A59424|nr:hypothetical protein [Gemmata obscuriglobus]
MAAKKHKKAQKETEETAERLAAKREQQKTGEKSRRAIGRKKAQKAQKETEDQDKEKCF